MTFAPLAFALASLQAEPPFPKAPLELPRLTDVEGRQYDVAAQKAAVLIFVSTDCPIANRYLPEISNIYTVYKSKKVALFTVYVDADANVEQIRKHQKEYRVACPAILDSKHALVHKIGATVTPQAAVIDSQRRLVYRGRIDDGWSRHGSQNDGEYRRDLRAALDELLAGKPITIRTTPAIGCFISDK